MIPRQVSPDCGHSQDYVPQPDEWLCDLEPAGRGEVIYAGGRGGKTDRVELGMQMVFEEADLGHESAAAAENDPTSEEQFVVVLSLLTSDFAQ